ncbi:hypothetical protein [Poriferisphaera sp. WC338]|uniref:hypothetical protein n=1 Tax=Poriferisphaera sp. WC338 TaxID=3425129 RepID=UPI003D817DCA
MPTKLTPSSTIALPPEYSPVDVFPLADENTVAIYTDAQIINAWELFIYYWPDLATVILIFTILFLLFRIKKHSRLKHISKGQPYCKQCVYQLDDSNTGTCPECGCGMVGPTQKNRRSAKRHHIRLLLSVLLCTTSAAALATLIYLDNVLILPPNKQLTPDARASSLRINNFSHRYQLNTTLLTNLAERFTPHNAVGLSHSVFRQTDSQLIEINLTSQKIRTRQVNLSPSLELTPFSNRLLLFAPDGELNLVDPYTGLITQTHKLPNTSGNISRIEYNLLNTANLDDRYLLTTSMPHLQRPHHERQSVFYNIYDLQDRTLAASKHFARAYNRNAPSKRTLECVLNNQRTFYNIDKQQFFAIDADKTPSLIPTYPFPSGKAASPNTFAQPVLLRPYNQPKDWAIITFTIPTDTTPLTVYLEESARIESTTPPLLNQPTKGAKIRHNDVMLHLYDANTNQPILTLTDWPDHLHTVWYLPASRRLLVYGHNLISKRTYKRQAVFYTYDLPAIQPTNIPKPTLSQSPSS